MKPDAQQLVSTHARPRWAPAILVVAVSAFLLIGSAVFGALVSSDESDAKVGVLKLETLTSESEEHQIGFFAPVGWLIADEGGNADQRSYLLDNGENNTAILEAKLVTGQDDPEQALRDLLPSKIRSNQMQAVDLGTKYPAKIHMIAGIDAENATMQAISWCSTEVQGVCLVLSVIADEGVGLSPNELLPDVRSILQKVEVQ